MSELGELFAEVEAEMAETEEGTAADNPVEEPADVNEDQEETDVETDTEDSDGVEGESGDEVSVWDWSEYQDQLIPIRVNGEDQTVSLKEVRDGYMRQSDYTRGKQSIAEVEKDAQWAKDFQRALSSDPAGTLEDIARAYGLLNEETQQEQAKADWNLEDLDEDVRPFAQAAMQANQQLAEMRRWMQEQERSAARSEQERLVSEVKAELAALETEWGSDLDPREALRLAAAANITLTEAAEMVVAKVRMKNGRLQGEVASKAAEAALQRAEGSRQGAKKVASQKSKSFKAADIPADDFTSIGDLMEQVIASQA